MTNPFSAHTTSTSLSACGLSLILEPRKLRFIFVLIIFVGRFFFGVLVACVFVSFIVCCFVLFF